LDINIIKKQWNDYYNEFENSDYMDIEKHTRMALKVGGLIQEIEKSYSKGYAMAKFDCASELLNVENDRRELIDQWYNCATNINKKVEG
jgi:hypothetical protein